VDTPYTHTYAPMHCLFSISPSLSRAEMDKRERHGGRYTLSMRPSALAVATAAASAAATAASTGAATASKRTTKQSKKEAPPVLPFAERWAACVLPAPAPGAAAVRGWADVRVGATVAGFVTNPTDKGVFISLTPTITGRCKVMATSRGRSPHVCERCPASEHVRAWGSMGADRWSERASERRAEGRRAPTIAV
jgi:hypothetical protein